MYAAWGIYKYEIYVLMLFMPQWEVYGYESVYIIVCCLCHMTYIHIQMKWSVLYIYEWLCIFMPWMLPWKTVYVFSFVMANHDGEC